MSNEVNKAFLNMFGGKEYDDGVIERGFRMMCANIRLGKIIDIRELNRAN